MTHRRGHTDAPREKRHTGTPRPWTLSIVAGLLACGSSPPSCLPGASSPVTSRIGPKTGDGFRAMRRSDGGSPPTVAGAAPAWACQTPSPYSLLAANLSARRTTMARPCAGLSPGSSYIKKSLCLYFIFQCRVHRAPPECAAAPHPAPGAPAMAAGPREWRAVSRPHT